MLSDRHVVKMVLETAQILCTIAHLHGHAPPYRPTHANHPCVIWAGAGYANWRWLVRHGLALCDEYTRRYERIHKSCAVIEWIEQHAAGPLRDRGRRQPFAQAMPKKYRGTDAVAAYRRYYIGEKQSFASWHAPAKPPAWWPKPKRHAAKGDVD